MIKFKSAFKKAAAGILSAALLASALLPGSFKAQAAEEDFTGEADVYIGFGGSGEAAGDWGLCYNSPDAEDNKGEIKATNGKIKVGDTVTVSLEMPEAVSHMYWMAPVVVAEGVSKLEADVTVKFDGKDAAINKDAGKAWWYEKTGAVDEKHAIRLGAGYNEWADKYIEAATGWTKVEYTITLKTMKTGGEAVGEAYDGEFSAFVAIGADKAAENDWGYGFGSVDASTAAEGIKAVTKEGIKVGDTFTVSLEFDPATLGVWYVTPVLLAENIGAIEADIACKINDADVAIDFSKSDLFWYEGTGDYTDNAIRLAGGYNEYVAEKQYIAKPEGVKKIEYTITIKSANVKAGEEGSAAGPVDLDGEYNAYIGFQTPTWSFRNSWFDNYGRDYTDDTGVDYFNQVSQSITEDDGQKIVKREGTLHDTAIKGNGKYSVSVDGLDFADADFEGQDYMNLIFLSTDIPNTGEVEISNMVLKVDGSEVEIKPIISPDSKDYLVMLIQNIWNGEVKEIGYYPVPMKEMAIEFEVSGFNYDKKEDTPAPTEEVKPDDSKKDDGSTEAAATETPTSAPTEAAKADEKKDDAKKDDEKKGLSTGAIAGIVAACVVVVGGAIGIGVSKKKK